MAMVTGGELVVRSLRQAGVEAIFGLHGAHIDAIFQACLDAGLPIIDTRHEASACHAAEGYARTLRCLGVGLVTAGGGLTNAMTPLANAWLDRTPLLVITGSGPLRDDQTNTMQAGFDQVAIATPVTKWAHRVVAPALIPRLVAQAIRIALTPPYGPVLLDIPWDVLTGELDDSSLAPHGPPEPSRGAAPHAGDIAAILALLAAAARPVIVVGSEASRVEVTLPLDILATSLGIPVFADFEGLNLLSALPDDLLGGLVQGLHGAAGRGIAPDAVLLLGVRFGINSGHGSGNLIPHSARVIQIDPDGRELGRLQPIERGIVASVAGAIEALAAAAQGREWPARSAWRRELLAFVQHRYDTVAAQAVSGERLHPFHASAVVAKHVDDNTVVVADGALTYLWLSEVISRARPGAFLCHGFLGAMGYGFGTAIGAQYAAARSGKRTILVTGDGSLGYSIAEFDTAVRKGLPLIVVVMNNRSWGATLHFQQMAVGPNRVTNTRLENGSYHDVAAAFGADGYWVDDAEGLDRALAAALAKHRPACINVLVDLDPVPPEELVLMGRDPI